MSKMKNIENLVKQCLEENKKAREDDFILILNVYDKILPPQVDRYSLNLISLFTNHKFYKLFPFESITRARRKLQNKYPELQAEKIIVEARSQEEVEYRNYALDKGN